MNGWKILVTEQHIQSAIQRSAKKLTAFMQNKQNKDWAVVCLLRGAFMVFTELVQYLPTDITCMFMYPHSYGDGRVSSGQLTIDYCGTTLEQLSNYNVLLVDDVCDTGNTLQQLKSLISTYTDCYTWVFMDKTENHSKELSPDFCAIENIPVDSFLVGMGLDYKGKMRNIKCVYDARR